jgi:hypothetical protein
MGVEWDERLGDGKSEHNRVKANCFVEGLTQATFHDKNNGKFPWASKLEQSGHVVAEELKAFLTSGDERWAGPRFVGTHYGENKYSSLIMRMNVRHMRQSCSRLQLLLLLIM